MPSYLAKPTAPNQDKRWKLVDATIRRQGAQQRGLIETLHTVQEAFGYLDEQALRYVAMSLRVPLSRAFGVATFYHFFTLKPAGEHTCVVCTGTACYIKGAQQLLDAAQKRLGIATGETTPDKKVSLLAARCLGSCGLAPAIVFDGEVAARVTAATMFERLGNWTGTPEHS
jgi:bidirectional [NiFe] hydrogenase diaphorase subunit